MNTLRGLSSEPGNGAFASFLGDLAALGVRPVAEGGRRFSVVKARSNARWWLVPRDDRRAAMAGFQMFHPVSTRAAAAKAAARLAVCVSPRSLPRSGQLRLDGAPDLGSAFGGEIAFHAYFTGTDGPHRKTTIQLMGPRGRILGYAKLSRVPRIMRFIEAEADTLAELDRLGLHSADVPRVMTTRREDALALLVTDSLKGAQPRIRKRLGPEHLVFLGEIAARTGGVGASDVFEELSGDITALDGRLSPDWTRRFHAGRDALRGTQARLPVCLAHGDFTPWNAFVQSGRLYAFDWEYARHGYPQGYDQLHFILATAGTDPLSAPGIVRRVLDDLARQRFAGDRATAREAALFSLLLHAAFYFGRGVEAGETRPGFEGEDMRGALIDVLLADGVSP